MTIGQMRDKLLEWHPLWNIDKFTDQQVISVYNKERNKLVQSIFKEYSNA